MRLLRRAVIGAVSVATMALAAFAAALITVRILGYSAAVVMSGSMMPAIPMGSLTIVTPTFVSTGTAIATLVAGAADTLNLTLKIKGGSAAGMYTGTILLTDQISGITASFPISVTH